MLRDRTAGAGLAALAHERYCGEGAIAPFYGTCSGPRRTREGHAEWGVGYNWPLGGAHGLKLGGPGLQEGEFLRGLFASEKGNKAQKRSRR
jgi:hypothetical protein